MGLRPPSHNHCMRSISQDSPRAPSSHSTWSMSGFPQTPKQVQLSSLLKCIHRHGRNRASHLCCYGCCLIFCALPAFPRNLPFAISLWCLSVVKPRRRRIPQVVPYQAGLMRLVLPTCVVTGLGLMVKLRAGERGLGCRHLGHSSGSWGEQFTVSFVKLPQTSGPKREVCRKQIKERRLLSGKEGTALQEGRESCSKGQNLH